MVHTTLKYPKNKVFTISLLRDLPEVVKFLLFLSFSAATKQRFSIFYLHPVEKSQ